jgi:flavodoxin
MKKCKFLLAIAALMVATVSCGSKKEEAPQKKVLVLYYSQTSNTKTVAQELANKLGADMEEIVPVKPYDGDFQATITRCQQEREQGITPEIKPLTVDLANYDVIFLGYPVWFGTFAPPMGAFLSQADLSGKKIVPFCTFGSGGLDSSIKDMKEKQPKAEILAGYGVRAARMKAVPNEVDQFLKAGGFIEGEFTKLDEFPEAHAVSEEESAIFNAAVGDYPMIQAEAKTVASRTIPGGTEYLFTAADKPRPGAPQGPGAGEMKVYVTVLEGANPEFTQVVR